MKDLVFSYDFLEDIVVPKEQVAELIADGDFVSEDADYMPKCITIRPGIRNFEAGEIVRGVSSEKNWHLPLCITKVVHKTFGEITEEEAHTDGFRDVQQITDPKEGLLRFYKPEQYDFSPAGPVTLIWFELNF